LLILSTAASAACGPSNRCEGISADEAIAMARNEKREMLTRSTQAYRENFASDAVAAVRIGPQTNGYAANVEFAGRNGERLIALIEDDCYVGWTGR
jgi:hypothetical protein